MGIKVFGLEKMLTGEFFFLCQSESCDNSYVLFCNFVVFLLHFSFFLWGKSEDAIIVIINILSLGYCFVFLQYLNVIHYIILLFVNCDLNMCYTVF